MPITPVRTSTTTTFGNNFSSPLLKLGAKGSAVAELQRLLAARGFSPGTADGEFGAETHRALIQFQAVRGLSRDGIAGNDTWRALRGSAPVTAPASSSELRSRILAGARAELGVREDGRNGGGARRYQSYFGRGVEKWCADFVSFVSTRAGRSLNFSYTPSLENHLRSSGRWKGRQNPQPGDIVMFDLNRDGTTDHTGIVESVNRDGSVNTIEGNTTNPNGAGEGVFRKHRTLAVIRGFANP